MSGRGEMRLIWANPFLELRAIAGVHVLQGSQQARDVSRLRGMYNVQIEGAQSGALKDGADSSHDEEVHVVFRQDSEQATEIRFRHPHLEPSTWHRRTIAEPEGARPESCPASSG